VLIPIKTPCDYISVLKYYTGRFYAVFLPIDTLEELKANYLGIDISQYKHSYLSNTSLAAQ